jgi:hypothetical protein
MNQFAPLPSKGAPKAHGASLHGLLDPFRCEADKKCARNLVPQKIVGACSARSAGINSLALGMAVFVLIFHFIRGRSSRV